MVRVSSYSRRLMDEANRGPSPLVSWTSELHPAGSSVRVYTHPCHLSKACTLKDKDG